MPYIPTETIVSAAILAALIAGWRYVQQNPQQEVIPAAVKKTANAVLPGGKGLFEDELTGEGGKKSKAGSKKSASKKKKSVGAAIGAGAASAEPSSSRVEQESEPEKPAPVQPKATEQKKPKTLAEKKAKKAPKTEVDE